MSRGCGRDKRDTDHFVIPSLRLNYIDTCEYIEPTRDRDKCWVLDSQRNILNSDPNKKTDKTKLKLGEHKKLNQFPPLTWCQPLQTSLRKRSLLRVAAVISDTHCFVNVYGLGVAGRITAPGGNTNRMLLIEAYSVWNSTIYFVPIPIPQLKVLLRGREELLIPGRKKELLKALIPLLFFDYTVLYTIPGDAEEVAHCSLATDEVSQVPQLLDYQSISQSDTETVLSSHSLFMGSQSNDLVLDNQNSVDHVDEIQLSDSVSLGRNRSISASRIQQPTEIQKSLWIHHLDKFSLPEGYPQTIAEIIRAMSSASGEDGETVVPRQLIQTLRIGPEVRENGPVVRRRDIEEKIRLEKIEEERKRQIWRDTPRRYKGWMAARCIRKYGKFVVMSSYRMPLKPTIMTIKGHIFEECVSLTHFLDLGTIGQSYKNTLNPRRWDEPTAKIICKKTTKLLSVGESLRSTLYLAYQHKTGSEIQLSRPKSCKDFDKRRSITKERNLRLPSRWDLVPDVSLDQSRSAGYFSSSNSCLGRHSTRRKRLYAGDPLCGSCQPRRDVGRPKRLITRAKKIGHMYGIYTLYLTGTLSSEPLLTIKDMEERVEMKYYGNEFLPASLGPTIELMIEIYFSDNPTFIARQRGKYDFGSEVINGPTVLRLTLQRGDLCRLIDDKYYLRIGFRVSHQEFYESSSEEEVTLVENVWKEIGDVLLSRCRWRRTLQGITIGSKGYYAKLVNATSLMSIESIDVTKEVLGREKDRRELTKPRDHSTAMISKVTELLCDSKAELVLVLSTVLHIQNCQINSLSENRQNVSLQVIIWQKGINLGLICYDWFGRDIYFVQPSQPEQETLCIPFQAAGREEISINLSLYVTSLTYNEEKSKDGTSRRFITLESSEEEDMTKEFAENNYAQKAIQESKLAFEAARSRQTATRGSIIQQEEDPWYNPPPEDADEISDDWD